MIKIKGEDDKEKKPQRPYVRDVGAPIEDTGKKVGTHFSMVVFSALVGLVIGFLVWGVFSLSTFLTELLWHDAGGALANFLSGTIVGNWWIPILFCTLGGLIIGLFTKYCGGQPRSLETVMREVKDTGGYKLERPGASVVGFLLPLVFGGSVGPEAGLTGIIAGACTWVGSMLRKAGLRTKSIADLTVSAALSAVFASPFVGIVAAAQEALPKTDDDNSEAESKNSSVISKADEFNPNAYDFRRKAKIVLYTAAGLGAATGVALFTFLFGADSGLPRFEGITPQLGQLWWCIPCMLLGYVGALLYHAGDSGFFWLSGRMGKKVVLKPVLAGLVLGAVAIWLPYVLFPGKLRPLILWKAGRVWGPWCLLQQDL